MADRAEGMGKTHRAGRPARLFDRLFGRLREAIRNAFEIEVAERRIFFWLPVAAGSAAIIYLLADVSLPCLPLVPACLEPLISRAMRNLPVSARSAMSSAKSMSWPRRASRILSWRLPWPSTAAAMRSQRTLIPLSAVCGCDRCGHGDGQARSVVGCGP
jgi:hypothetical protein